MYNLGEYGGKEKWKLKQRVREGKGNGKKVLI